MPMPSVYVTRFFQLITARKFAEAERVLLRLRQRIPKTEWNTGYFQALRGMLLAQRSNDDRYVFLSNLNFKDPEELQRHRREFLKQARNRLHADYDRGFFAAWASYMRVLAKLQFDADKIKSKSQAKKEVETKTEAKKAKKEKKEETETVKEKERRKVEKVVEAETRKGEIEKAEGAERVESGQRTLFDFS
jgi:hypothetical protein